jgi:FkbM family methyltransferase
VHLPGQRTWASYCAACRFNDHGIRTVEPRRLDGIHRGVGDTVADLLKIVGIEKQVGCGCSTRQSWLNQAVSYERLPTLAREGKTWAAMLCRALGIKTGMEPQRILFRFPHGFGDAVQFTVVLQHLRAKYPQNTFDVVTKPGCASLFRGLADRAIEQPTAEAIWGWQADEQYDFEHAVEWWEPDGCYTDSPATKAEKCLREAFGIEPQLELCRYKIEWQHELPHVRECLTAHGLDAHHAPHGFVLIHYQGTTSKQNKNIDEQVIRATVRRIRAEGCVPVVLDWDNRSCYARGKCSDAVVIDRTSPLWHGTETGDGATLAALASQAMLCIGIDSGPGHVFGATDTPTLILWHKHHPLNYYSLSPNVTHVLPHDHQSHIFGDADAGARFFRRNYRHYTCERHLRNELPELVERMLRGERIDMKAKHTTELFRGVRVRRRLRHGDVMVVDDVIRDDCYQVRATFPKGPINVLDVGAHIGSFAWWVTKNRPEAELAYVEPIRANWHLLRANAPDAYDFRGACLYNATNVRLKSTVNRASRNTGGSEVVYESGYQEPCAYIPAPGKVKLWTLEQIMYFCGWNRIDVLKLDCEGAEVNILKNTTSLDRIGMIVGEWHDREALDRIVAERFAGWRFEVLRDATPNGLFRLTH